MKQILCILLTLCLLLPAVALADDDDWSPIAIAGVIEGALTEEALDDFPDADARIVCVENGRDATHDIEGATLRDVLTSFGVDVAALYGITVTGANGESVNVPAAILQNRTIYIAEECDDDERVAPMLAIDGAQSRYWIRNVTRLELYAQGEYAVNSRVDIRHAGNATTGYDWTATSSDPAVLAIVADEYVPDAANRLIAGGGGTHWWVADAGKAGSATVTLTQTDPAGQTVDTQTIDYAVDDGQNITLVGTTLPTVSVTLEENGSTGYVWSYAIEGTGQIGQLGCVVTGQSTDAVGSPYNVTWTFNAVKDGDVAVTFKLCRPWEDALPEQTVVNVYTIADGVFQGK